MDELELLSLVKTDPSQFSQIFKVYYKPVFGYIFRRTGDFYMAADITSEAFLKAFISIKNFSYKGISIKVWLYRIATNELNQYFRQKRKYDSLFDKVEPEEREKFSHYLSLDREELESELQKHEQYLEVLKALKTLKLKYQEVIALKYFENKSNREIAEILDINEGTLKSLLSRGVGKLREKCNQML